MHLAIDGMLEPAEQYELERHLAECSACRQRYERLSEAVALLQASQMVEPPLGMPDRVMHEIRLHKRRKRRMLAWARGIMWALLVIALAAIAILAVPAAQEMLASDQSVYASIVRNLLSLYQFGLGLASGMRVILVALFGQTSTATLAIYATLAAGVATVWLRVIARGASMRA
ncbi:MAG: anti-sigma factor family protein [Anaerolineae bacterium]